MASSIHIPFIVWILCVGISALVIGFCIRYLNTNEGFSNASQSPISITTCPYSTATYITGSGSTNCCDGDIVDGKCNGTIACSLSFNAGNGILSCNDWVTQEWAKRSTTYCPKSSMPNYFGSIQRTQDSSQGCSASPCSSDGTAPSNPSAPRCKIYQTSNDDYAKVDSCFNIKARDAMAVPIPTATKQVIEDTWSGKKYSALLSATYLPPNGSSMVPVTCYDWDRVSLFLNAIDTTGASTAAYSKMKDVDVFFCGASKAYYVDGTLTKANAKGVRS